MSNLMLVVLFYKDVIVESHAVERPADDHEMSRFYDRQRDARRDWLHRKRMNPDNTPPLWHATISQIEASEVTSHMQRHASSAEFFAAVGYDPATGTFSSREPAVKPKIPTAYRREFPSKYR